MHRFAFLAVCLLGCAGPADHLPNVVLIMADDLGFEALGINGSTSFSTPHLDELARTGMRFVNVHSTPLCTPSRVQLMTGRYGFRNYVGFGLLDPEETTFAHLLREAGYRVGVFGKWQLYGNGRQRELAGRGGSTPEQAGFDEYALWQVKERGSRFWNPTLRISGEDVRQFPGEYGPDLFADHVEAFMERHRDGPFFAYYPMVLTHDPFQPTPPAAGAADVDPALNDTTHFADNVAYMDRIVGRIVAKLDDLGLRERTLVLFIADNGTDRDVISGTPEGRVRGNKGYPTRLGTHVPMIANWPGTIAAGQVNDNLIDFTDFLPTLTELAGRDPPDSLVTDGLGFSRQLLGTADSVRSWIFCHYDPRWGRFERSRWAQDRTFKLYDTGAFHDLVSDPDELAPLRDSSLDERAASAKRRLQAALDTLR